MKMFISIDPSLSCCGVAMYSDEGDLVWADYITLNKIHAEDEIEEMILKANEVMKVLHQKIVVADYSLSDVILEAPLLKSNNQFTTIKLARFNMLLSVLIYNEFKIITKLLAVADWRREFNLKNKRGEDLKVKYANEIMKIYPDIKLDTNKNGKIRKECYDMTDAICIGYAFFKKKSSTENQ